MGYIPAPIPPAQVWEPKSSMPFLPFKPSRYKGEAIGEATCATVLAIAALVVGVLSIAALSDPKLARGLGLEHTSVKNIKMMGGLLVGLSIPVALIGYYQLMKGKKPRNTYQQELANYNELVTIANQVTTITRMAEATPAELSAKGNAIVAKMIELRNRHFINLQPNQSNVNFVLDNVRFALRISYDPNSFNEIGNKTLEIMRHLNYKLDQMIQINRSRGDPLHIGFAIIPNNQLTSVIQPKAPAVVR